MIKLTEVVTSPSEYDPELERVRCTYSLRSFYVNPRFIVSVADNSKFNSLHERSPVVKDLIPQARFTKIVVATGVHGTTLYNVLGTPEQHLQSIKENVI